ncbi:MAG: sulfatase, partial [Verrucomicrobiota bacterium]
MQKQDQPNILFIFTDQQCADMLSCAGNGDLATPNLDRLASRGTRFERAYCAQPLCVPSRGAMSTGRYPHEIGVPFNYHPHERSADESISWVGELLRQAGYETAYFGKWHQPIHPDKIDIHGWETLGLVKDAELPDRCDAFFAAARDKPFFLTVSIQNPHDICQFARGADLPQAKLPPPPPPDQCPELPANFAIDELEPDVLRALQPRSPAAYPSIDWTPAQWRQFRWAYARLVESIDRIAGDILARLESHGLENNTLVVFSSDHGDGNAAHHWNQKQVLYEEPCRVPLIVVDPQASTAGAVDRTHLASTGLDLLPTFCDYAGVPLPPDKKGRSLRPLTTGQADGAWREHLVVETEFGIHSKPFDIAGRAVYSDRYKYIVYSEGERREQFFDLHADPGETANLIDNPDLTALIDKHRQALHKWKQETNDGEWR